MELRDFKDLTFRDLLPTSFDLQPGVSISFGSDKAVPCGTEVIQVGTLGA